MGINEDVIYISGVRMAKRISGETERRDKCARREAICG